MAQTEAQKTEHNQKQLFEVDSPLTRDILDSANEERLVVKSTPGVTEDVVRLISSDKKEPQWMLDLRLKALKIFHSMPIPKWGPNLDKLKLSEITYFAKPDAKESKNWDDVPADIRRTFERLGIPEAERTLLAGAGSQYDSEMVYHNLKEEWAKLGVIFENMDVALHQYPELVKEYFMTKCVPITDHKFSALHAAVWSGGTFIYVPKGVKIQLPLQAYFRMNTKGAGQFEHTLIIVDEGAEVMYIEGCFTKGNLVTSNPDYNPIEEIKEQQKVLTSEGSFKTTKDIQQMPYSGDLYTVEIYGDSTQKIEVTPEHPFLYVDRKRARDRNKIFTPRWNVPLFFKEKDYLCVPINKEIKTNTYHEFEIEKGNKRGVWEKKKINVPLTNEFFRLVGYYLAEGSVSSNSYLNFSFNINERAYVEDVKQCLKSVFGVEKVLEMVHKKNNGVSVVVCSVDLARIFKQLGDKCDRKALLPWMMYETKEHQQEILKGWFRGDGNYYNKRSITSGWLKESLRINTTSEKLVRQMRDVALRLGVVAFINRRERSHEGRRAMFTLGFTGEHMIKTGKLLEIKIDEKIHGKNRASMFGIDENFAYLPIKSVSKKIVADIPVYNFGVEDHETFTVGGVAVHNCSAPQYTANSLHAGCVEVYIKKGARARYSSVENWSKNTYNLNTKRAVVEEDGFMEWIGGNMGCLTGDSQIFTNPKGPVSIKSIEPGSKVYVWDSITNTIKKSKIKAKIFSGNKKVYRLRTTGREIEASGNHPFLTLTRTKNNFEHKKAFFHTEWKPLEELKPGDLIGIAKKLPLEGASYKLPTISNGGIVTSNNQYSDFEMNTSHLYNKKIKTPKQTNEDFMWLMGLILGDGFVDMKENKINIATHETEDYREHLCAVIKNIFNYPVTQKKDRYIVINSKMLCVLFQQIGFTGKANTKNVPRWVFSLPENEILAFLSGYFDSDGHVQKDRIAFTSINRKMLEDIKTLGISVGFAPSNIIVHRKACRMLVINTICNTHDSWRLFLGGKKIKMLPTRCARKKLKIEKANPKINYVSARGLNFHSKVNDEIGFTKITNIEYTGIKPTYDIEVENYHNFISNGLIVHNSAVTMLYPCSILKGRRARADHTSIAFAGKGQDQDTGAKVIHLAPETSCTIKAKSISKDGGITTYRGFLKINKGASDAKAHVLCDALILDKDSISNTTPHMEINEQNVDIAHEATTGRISEEKLFYLMSRGLSEEEAVKLVVSGFIEPIVKQLPLEYAVELNRLIELEIEGVG